MTRAELQALLDAAGITDVTLENTPHPHIVYIRVCGSAVNQARAWAAVANNGRLALRHTWIDRDTRARVLRVELLG